MTYSSSLRVSQREVIVKRKNLVKYDREIVGARHAINVIMAAVAVCLLLILYITQVTRTNSLAVNIGNLNQQQKDIVAESESLDLETARLQSLNGIKNSEVTKNLSSVKPEIIIR